jgi:hypothetical protein
MQLALSLPGRASGLYGTVWVLAWAFTINALPYGVRYSHAGMLQIHAELEEAAAMAGASSFASLRRIVVPLLAPALSAGWLFTFLLCMRALSLPVLLSGPNAQTLAVALFDLSANGQAPELAAMDRRHDAYPAAGASLDHGRDGGAGPARLKLQGFQNLGVDGLQAFASQHGEMIAGDVDDAELGPAVRPPHQAVRPGTLGCIAGGVGPVFCRADQ